MSQKYEAVKKWNQVHPYEYWATTTISGHKSRGFIASFGRNELVALAKKSPSCYICGAPLDWTVGTKNGRVRPNSPTMDRLYRDTSNLRYKILKLKDVGIACHRCNTVKSTMTLPEFNRYCKRVVARFAAGRVRKG